MDIINSDNHKIIIPNKDQDITEKVKRKMTIDDTPQSREESKLFIRDIIKDKENHKRSQSLPSKHRGKIGPMI